MFPRLGRPHDQFLIALRATVVAGIGGLIIGHIVWLVAISFATRATAAAVNAWVLVIAAICVLVAVAGGLMGRKLHRRKEFTKAAFLWCLPVLPVLLSLSVLASTYL